MKFLLDTHAWLWMGAEPKRLGRKTRAILEDLDNELMLSAVSTWEIVIKASSGKLQLPTSAQTYIRSRLKRSRTTLLPIDLDHTLAVATLPAHHADPFDRLIIAQAQVEGLTIISADRRISEYGVVVQDARR